MRHLFVHPSIAIRSNHEGAVKSFKAMVAALAARGHACEVVTGGSEDVPDPSEWHRLCSVEGGDRTASIRVSQSRLAWTTARRQDRRDLFTKLSEAALFQKEFYALARRRIAELEPTWVVCEAGTVNLRLLYALARGRLVLGVTTTAALPFGPRRATPWWSTTSASIYPSLAKIFCASRYLQDYLRTHGRVEALFQPQVAYGTGPFERCGRADGVITMVNPAPFKGGSVFVRLAAALPRERFRAVLSYADPAPGLERLPNVEIVPPNDDLGHVLAGSKALLVPSMWGEGWGMVCVDAMLRGVPVIASDDGGIPEATLGAGLCIPAQPGRLRRRWAGELSFSGGHTSLDRWIDALTALGDPDGWQRSAASARAAADAYVGGLSVDALCDYLRAP